MQFTPVNEPSLRSGEPVRVPWAGGCLAPRYASTVELSGQRVIGMGFESAFAVPSDSILQSSNCVAMMPGPLIVLGVLNCTSWSRHFQNLLQAANL